MTWSLAAVSAVLEAAAAAGSSGEMVFSAGCESVEAELMTSSLIAGGACVVEVELRRTCCRAVVGRGEGRVLGEEGAVFGDSLDEDLSDLLDVLVLNERVCEGAVLVDVVGDDVEGEEVSNRS